MKQRKDRAGSQHAASFEKSELYFKVQNQTAHFHCKCFEKKARVKLPNTLRWTDLSNTPKLYYLHVSTFFLTNEFLAGDRTPLTRVRQMWNDIPHLPNPSLGGSISRHKYVFYENQFSEFGFPQASIPAGASFPP